MAFQETSQAIFSGDVEKLPALRETGGEGFARQRTEKEEWDLLRRCGCCAITGHRIDLANNDGVTPLRQTRDADPDVIVAAADSLSSMMKTTFELSSEDFRRISAVRDSAGPVVRIVLGNFLQKVSVLGNV